MTAKWEYTGVILAALQAQVSEARDFIATWGIVFFGMTFTLVAGGDQTFIWALAVLPVGTLRVYQAGALVREAERAVAEHLTWLRAAGYEVTP